MRKILATVIAALVIIGGLQAVELTVASAPAYADQACPDGVGCITQTVNIISDPSGGGGIGDPGGGSTGTGTGTGPRTDYETINFMPLYNALGGYKNGLRPTYFFNTYANGPIEGTCPLGPGGTSAVSVTVKYFLQTKVGKVALEVWCTYPPGPPNPNTVKRTVRCYIDYDAYLYQAQTKAAIASGGTRPGGASNPNPQLNLDAPGPAPVQGLNNSLNMDACGPFTGGATFNLNTPENGGYGYYRLDLNPRYRNCSLIGYPAWTNNTSRDRIECGGLISAGTFSNYAVSACNYNYIKYSSYAAVPNNVNFAISACEDFRCVVDGNTTILGHTDAISVMRNGEDLPVEYATIHIEHGPTARPEGGAAGYDISATTNVADGSSPYNKSTNVNGAKQYFQLKDTTGKRQNFGAWEPQGQTSDLLAFNWASDRNQTWRLERTWRVNNAEFYVPIPNNTGGGFTMGWQNEVIYCGLSTSNPVTVVRSVNE